MMMLVYGLLAVLVGSYAFLARRKATGLEKRFVKASDKVDEKYREGFTPPGGVKESALVTAKHSYALGGLVQERDDLEKDWCAAQTKADTWTQRSKGLKEWKGRKLPYTLGMADVAGLLALADKFCPDLTLAAVTEKGLLLFQKVFAGHL